MDSSQLLYPVIVLVTLTFAVAIRLLRLNISAYAKGDVAGGYFKVYQGEAPEYLLAARDHYKNLFELPVLFYLLMVLLIYTGFDTVDIWLAWGFVLLRCVHSYIRWTSNFVPYRYRIFVAGGTVLLSGWVKFILHILLSNPG